MQMANTDKSFTTIAQKYGDEEFWMNEKNQKAFGKFMDYLREIHKSSSFDSEEGRAIFKLSRYRINQELILKNYDLFSQTYEPGEDDEENIKEMRRLGKILKIEEVRNIFNSYSDSYSTTSKGKRYYNVRDARGRFVKKS